MRAHRILYRTRQFRQALGANLASEDLVLVRAVLTPAQQSLFDRLQPSEKAHSIRVLRALLEQGEEHPDLLEAALLHDVGKSRFHFKLWERVWIVLGQALFPGLAKRWGSEPPEEGPRSGDPGHQMAQNLRRSLIVAERHPVWGAEMAAEAGTSPLAVALIRRHQDDLEPSPNQSPSLEERLLRKLQSVDDNS